MEISDREMKYICLAVLLLAVLPTAADETVRPNIVIVMADDIGLGDIGFYHRQRTGQEPVIPTPNLDRLIEQGMRFSDAHSPAPLCAPTRASMLTGNFPERTKRIFGTWLPHKDPGIDPRWTTGGRLAQAGGYHTAFFGKWGLGGSWTTDEHAWDRLDAGALAYGFDYAMELPEGIQNAPLAFYENQQWVKLHPDSTLKELSIDQAVFHDTGGRNISPELIGDSHWDPSLAGPMLTERAVAYINGRTKDHPDQPFFVYFCSQAVHIPHTPPAALGGVDIAGSTHSPFGDMLREFDAMIGVLMDSLDKAGVADSTLFIVTSDNGPLLPKRQQLPPVHDSSHGLREQKGSIYEGGHRVPFIARWPAVIEPGSETDELIVTHDVVATIARLAGQPIDRNVLLDSIDLTPLFRGEPLVDRHAIVIHQSKWGPQFALREGPWKLVMKTSRYDDLENLVPSMLFNLDENLSESDQGNLIDAPEHTDRIIRMHKRYLEHRRFLIPTVKSTE